MTLTALLGIGEGERVAVIGAGGKTSLIDQLGDEWADRGALIAPTTRIERDQVRERPGVTYLGHLEGKKLAGASPDAIEAAAKNYAITLMEADGSRRMPLKGWADHEPSVPDFATLTVGVINVRAIGLVPSDENTHRLPLFLAQTGLIQGEAVTRESLIRMIQGCLQRHARGRSLIVLREEDGTWTAI